MPSGSSASRFEKGGCLQSNRPILNKAEDILYLSESHRGSLQTSGMLDRFCFQITVAVMQATIGVQNMKIYGRQAATCMTVFPKQVKCTAMKKRETDMMNSLRSHAA